MLITCNFTDIEIDRLILGSNIPSTLEHEDYFCNGECSPFISLIKGVPGSNAMKHQGGLSA